MSDEHYKQVFKKKFEQMDFDELENLFYSDAKSLSIGLLVYIKRKFEIEQQDSMSLLMTVMMFLGVAMTVAFQYLSGIL